MLGGNNNNSLAPVFLDENLFQYPSNASNQLQLFGNVNYSTREQNSPVFRPNKRPREAADPNLIQQKKHQISLNHNFYHEDSSIPNQHHVSTGLKLSYDDEERNSSITSASAGMTLAPSIMSSFGDSITTELDRHKEELERFIMIQEENMLKGIRDIRQRHTNSFLSTIEKEAANKLHKKELEIQAINRKNKELLEKIKHISNEAQNWHYRAKYNESMVNILKTNLQQALLTQGTNNNNNLNQIKEGFGDTDENDAVSSVNPINHFNNNSVAKSSVCKVCKVKEVSILVMPCRHLSLCKECDRFTSECPVCQIGKTVSLEVYLS